MSETAVAATRPKAQAEPCTFVNSVGDDVESLNIGDRRHCEGGVLLGMKKENKKLIVCVRWVGGELW